MKNYLPIDIVADLNQVEPQAIKALYFKNKDDERFNIIDGKLCVIEDYYSPLKNELHQLLTKAVMVANSENDLCYELAKISNYSYDTLRKYFYRATFKQMQKAKELIELLKKYINQNSLFKVEELEL